MEDNIEKGNKIWLMLVWIYIAAAVYILLYGGFFLNEIITSAIGAVLIINYLVRKRKYKLETFLALIDAKGILAVLVAVIIFSKITGQLYYSRVKKEIGF